MKNTGGDFPHMPWFTGDFMRETRGWSVTAKGLYRELIDMQWDMGSLPEDGNRIFAISGATQEEWEKGWHLCEPKFPVVNGKRINPRIEALRAKVSELSTSRSAAGKAGAAARWSGSDGKGNAIANAVANADANGKTMASKSKSKSKEEELRDVESGKGNA